MLLYCVERLVAYNVLHFARILGRSFGVDAEQLEISGQQCVALVYLRGDLDAGLCEAQMPHLVGNKIAAVFEQPDRTADARLRHHLRGSAAGAVYAI